uniref:CSON007599 protein n=1 Tax=Culicoides sonorensis TaxID=179676 RepID=A0A336LE36_CULSO
MIRLTSICLLFVACGTLALPAGKHDVKDEVAGVASNNSNTNNEKPMSENELTNPRKTVITYDQRQEGKFNVRADLENFVIVFVPSSPSQGMSLLEMLASMRRNQGKHSGKRITSKDSASVKVKQDDEPTVKTTEQVVDHFIEGRTPYKVDISSSLTQSDQESVVEGYSNNNRNVIVVESRHKRVPKHLGLYNNNLKSNSVVALINPPINRRSSSGDGYDVDELYATKDLISPRFIVASSSPYLKALTDSIPSIDSLKLEETDNDWKLLGATEPGCGPEKNMRRDSYGICRYFPLDI